MSRPIRVRPAGDAAGLAGGLGGLDPLLARLYAARGITRGEELDLRLAHLAPVSSMTGIEPAVELLLAHRAGRVLIAGDFDVDGATSAALAVRCLCELGYADVDHLVPSRFAYGYGLTPEVVRSAAECAPDLLLTVDNGTSSVEGVAEANRLGIDVLVTDHHLPGSELPAARAIVNPHLPGSAFAGRHIAGVGVTFYLMAALGRALEQRGLRGAAKVPARCLDLVALGTVADVVRLDHNNRILVHQGLLRIQSGKCAAGISALLAAAGRDARRATAADLAFAVAPRLNAAGRLEDMGAGIACLLEDDPGRALALAQRLDEVNRARREIEAGMREQAFAAVEALEAGDGMPSCVALYDRSWHEGVVGLVAARVRERCHRPAFAFAPDGDGALKGSARSVPGVHIRDLVEAVAVCRPGLVAKFGGHAMAAGLSIAPERFEEFAAAACEQLARLYPAADFSGEIMTDGELPREYLSLAGARTLRAAGPWGAGFEEPVFTGDFQVLEQRTVGGSHLKLRLRPLGGDGAVDAIVFNHGDVAVDRELRLVFRVDVNAWQGIESLQLIVEHLGQRGNIPRFSAPARRT